MVKHRFPKPQFEVRVLVDPQNKSPLRGLLFCGSTAKCLRTLREDSNGGDMFCKAKQSSRVQRYFVNFEVRKNLLSNRGTSPRESACALCVRARTAEQFCEYKKEVCPSRAHLLVLKPRAISLAMLQSKLREFLPFPYCHHIAQ